MASKLKRPVTVTQRIGAGFFIAILALLSAGIIETVRYRQAAPVRALYEADGGDSSSSSPDPLDPKYAQPMSIWVQVVPYYLLGASEAFTNVGVMELFYTGVSSGMRSIGSALYLLTVALGTYGATVLNLIVSAASTSDPWVANNSLYGHFDWYFYLNAGILAAALVVYIPVSKRYVERPVPLDSDADPFDQEGRAHGELANVARAWPSVSRASRVSELRLRRASAVEAAAAG
jgi:solute carrier family 15 (peptide/histidine transporter), member 3/4